MSVSHVALGSLDLRPRLGILKYKMNRKLIFLCPRRTAIESAFGRPRIRCDAARRLRLLRSAIARCSVDHMCLLSVDGCHGLAAMAPFFEAGVPPRTPPRKASPPLASSCQYSAQPSAALRASRSLSHGTGLSLEITTRCPTLREV